MLFEDELNINIFPKCHLTFVNFEKGLSPKIKVFQDSQKNWISIELFDLFQLCLDLYVVGAYRFTLTFVTFRIWIPDKEGSTYQRTNKKNTITRVNLNRSSYSPIFEMVL